jgi:hypothetical protein
MRRPSIESAIGLDRDRHERAGADVYGCQYLACPLFIGLPAAEGQEPQARIKIGIDRTIGEVHPLVFGNFAERLGRHKSIG